MPSITAKNLLSYYTETQNKSLPTLVILPGWKNTSETWTSCATKLSDRFHVIVIDLPGFGKTQKPDEDWNVFDYASFVCEIAAKLNIENAILMGHSFGGRVATVLAASKLVNFTINKLVLVDSAGIEGRSLSVLLRITAAKLLKPLTLLLPKKLRYNIRSKVGSSDYNNAGDMQRILSKVSSQNLTRLLPKISIPTLVIWGSKDDLLSIELTKIYKKLIPNCKVRVVWKAGHAPQLDSEAGFLQILSEEL